MTTPKLVITNEERPALTQEANKAKEQCPALPLALTNEQRPALTFNDTMDTEVLSNSATQSDTAPSAPAEERKRKREEEDEDEDDSSTSGNSSTSAEEEVSIHLSSVFCDGEEISLVCNHEHTPLAAFKARHNARKEAGIHHPNAYNFEDQQRAMEIVNATAKPRNKPITNATVTCKSLCYELTGPRAIPPRKASRFAAGIDLFQPQEVMIHPRQISLIDTEVSVALPPGSYGRLTTKSTHHMLALRVCSGVIDRDYKGTIKVALWNVGEQHIIVTRGHPIAQLVIEQYVDMQLI